MTPEESQQLLDNIQAMPKAVDDMTTAMSNFATSSSNYFAKTSSKIADMNSNIAAIAPTIELAVAGIVGGSKIFEKFGQSGAMAVNTISDQFTELINNTSDFTELSKALGIDPSKFKSFSDLKNEVLKVGQSLLDSVSSAQKFENGLLHLISSAGGLKDVMSNGRIDTEKLSERMTAFNETIGNVARSTGFTREQVAGFAQILMEIPGAIDQSVKVGQEFTQNMSELTAATKLASGSGQDLSQVVSVLKDVYDNFNLTGTESLKIYAYINEAAQKLGMRFEDVKKFTMEVSDQLKYFGNETEGSIRVLNRYSEALKETGLGAKASQDLIENMVKSVGNLSVGTKAFLSLKSGGAGGLQGAFQIDKLLREGKIDEVTKMLEDSLKKQLGGKIVSLDQAAGSQQAAAQYQKQISLVQSSAFGNLVKSPEQAERLFDALASGNVGKASELLDSSKALYNTVESGNEIQSQTKTILSEANASLGKLVGLAAIQAQSSGAFKNLTAAGSSELSKNIQTASDIANNKSTNAPKLQNNKEAGVNDFNEIIEDAQDIAKGIGEIISNFSDAAGKKVKDVINKWETSTSSQPTKNNENFTSIFDLKNNTDEAKLPANDSILQNQTKSEDKNTILLPAQPILPDININLTHECPTCGDKKLAHKIDNAFGSIKSAPYNQGTKK